MRKIIICLIFSFIILPCFANNDFLNNVQWVQLANKIYIDNNFVKFMNGTNFNKALAKFKILNDNYFEDISGKKVWYAQGMCSVECSLNQISYGLDYYDLSNQFLKRENFGWRIPLTSYDKVIFNYTCTTRREHMLNLIKDYDNIMQKNRQTNALENIADELFLMNFDKK